MEKVAAEIRVNGHVQGVFFRAFTEEAAIELGLNGFCQNLIDGCVLIKVEGERSVIEELLKKLWAGPSRAHVVDIEVSWGPFLEKYISFSIC